MLEAALITVERRGCRILSEVTAAFRPGEFVAICGPNGAGKSTLLKVLSGELAATCGRALLDGRDIARMTAPELAARRAVVPQATVLSFPFTVTEVVRLGASVPGFADTDAAAARAVERVGLAGLEHRPYLELSGGERQRVHFARALCQIDAAQGRSAGTIVLLLDEPTASLDLAHQAMLLAQARDEARRGRVVVSVLHDLNLAAQWADNIMLLADGVVVGFGEPRTIIADDLLSRAYRCSVRANRVPANDAPFILPQLVTLDTVRSAF